MGNLQEADVVIVGASFAGLLCARVAAIRGLRTVVIEAKSDPGARIHTTGILVKEAGEEIDLPPSLTRTIHAVRLYAPNLHSIDLVAPGYYFLTTDTAALMRYLAREAENAGARIISNLRLAKAERRGGKIYLPQLDLSTRYLVGADGARSTVAKLFGLGRNTRFLVGLETEYADLPQTDPRFLHCFLDTRRAPGYLAWVAPAPGFFQVGIASNGTVKPDLRAFERRTQHIFGFAGAQVKERRSGLIPVGGKVSPFAAPNVLLIGDAAGHVSPMTGGGIRLALRYGRRAGQLIADHLQRGGPPPDMVLAREVPSFGAKLLLRRTLDLGPPNFLYDVMLSTPLMRWFAQRVYFHRRSLAGSKPEAIEQPVKEESR
ncbi:MAG: NAD(P)/FAD-dependent oxidoreductase [Parvibaculaceae bacterium]